MKLSDLGEFGLIANIRKSIRRTSPSVLIGIGDDAAAVKISPAAFLLATTDMLIEGVHFDLAYTGYYSLGWKSAAVNLSDIAAMGGLPRYCLVSLGISPSNSVEQIADFYRGLNAILRRHHTELVGGDTCASRKGLLISVTALGEAQKARVIKRQGARPGDRIFVTSTLGDSAAGLEILKAGSGGKGQGARRQGAGVRRKDFGSEPLTLARAFEDAGGKLRSPNSALIRRHLRPVPRVEWGRAISLSGCANAMIDISDGLSSDLAHICEQSDVGAVVQSSAIPLSRAIRQSANVLKKPPLYYALTGGEDYELLFTVPLAKLKRFAGLKIPATEIGVITSNRHLAIIDADGRKKRLVPGGYDHFSRS